MISPIRFGGLASGIDTDSMVKQLMSAERMPMDRMFQRKQWAEWQRDSFRDVNSKLLEFRNAAADMRLQGTFNARKVTSTDESSVTAKAVGAGSNFSSQMKVNQVAEAAYLNSSEAVNINPLNVGALTSKVGQKFSINGEEFEVKSGENLNQLMNRINNSDAGVSMFYDTHTKKVSMSAKETGVGGINLIDHGADDFLQGFLKLNKVEATEDDPANYSNGKNAIFTLNGLETQRTSNVFTVSGVEYNIKAVSSATVSISSTTDTDAIFDKIKGFVDKYNEIIGSMNESLQERRYRDFQPLTTEQRSSMGEKEIEIWDEKSKSGLLRGDQMLSGILSDMRMKMSAQVKGIGNDQFSSLFDIGIKTGDYSERGMLHIDENKLREAIQENPEGIVKLFTNQSDNIEEKGIGARIYESLNDSIRKISEKAGNSGVAVDNSFMYREIKRYDEQIQRFESRLADVENRYWRQFTAMEKAMSQLNSQGDWLMQHMSQGKG